jgi:5'-nucleotidase
VDKNSVDTVTEGGVVREIKEWQSVMDYISSLPVQTKGGLPIIPVDERASEVRAIKVG